MKLFVLWCSLMMVRLGETKNKSEIFLLISVGKCWLWYNSEAHQFTVQFIVSCFLLCLIETYSTRCTVAFYTIYNSTTYRVFIGPVHQA